MGLVKTIVRVLAVVGKEITEVFRRPGAVLSLILGPFLILAIFGAGYQGVHKQLRTILVIGADSKLPQDLATYQALDFRGMQIIEVTPDRSAAEAQLRSGAVDVVVVPPSDPLASVEAGQQARIEVIIDLADPVQAGYAGFLADTMASAVNQEIYRQGAAEGQAYAISIGGRDLSAVPPDVIAAPTRAEVINLTPPGPRSSATSGRRRSRSCSSTSP